MKEINKDRVAAYLADKQCDLHEGQAQVMLSSHASLRTFLYEGMSIVNNRLLAVNSIRDPLSLEPLMSNHLITMKF